MTTVSLGLKKPTRLHIRFFGKNEPNIKRVNEDIKELLFIANR